MLGKLPIDGIEEITFGVLTEDDAFIEIETIDFRDSHLNVLAESYPTPKRILKNPTKNATTVFWDDGTKTVVKRSPEDPDDDYFAFCSALAIKMYGSNSKLHRMLKDKTEVLVKKKSKEKNDEGSGEN